MGQAVQKFELVDGGCFDLTEIEAKHLTKHPQSTPEKWVTSTEVERLSGVAGQTVRKVLANRSWRGCDLLVREEFTGRGQGGKTLLVHVDSLPADLRAAWYLERGIKLHEKVDAETGETILIPEEAYRNDRRHEADLALARWRHEVIRPVLILPRQSAERAALIKALAGEARLHPNGTRRAVTPQTLYNWVAAFEAEGLHGLMRKRRSDTGAKRTGITRAWDGFFASHIDVQTQNAVADEITGYIKGLWRAGERGWRAISEKSTTRLIEVSRDLRVVAFDALPLGRLGDTGRARTQFGVCCINRRMVELHRDHKLAAIRDKDNAVFQDRFMPSIRRDYSDLLPRQIVVGDVHPVDIICVRPNGRTVHPKAIAWYDVATNEMHMTFVFLEEKEGIRREHVAQAFQAMVTEWGLPQMLYLDNGGEYSDPDMVRGFTELSRLTDGVVQVRDVQGDPDVSRRVRGGIDAIVRSRPYNAKGKPGIEGAFGNLEQVFFATVTGWVAGDRMAKKTHAKGRDPVTFPGDESAFVQAMAQQLDAYHKRPQSGKLKGRSPNEVLRDFIEGGWGKTVLSSPNVLALAFADICDRTPDRGRISYTPRRGPTIYFYADELLGLDRRITLRVPAFNPDRAFCFDGDTYLCEALPERRFGVLDPAGAEEGSRRAKALRRRLADQGRNVARLSLTDEAARHLSHLPDAPEAPVAAVVDTGILERLADRSAQDAEEARAEIAARQSQRQVEQFKPRPVAALQGFALVDDEEQADE